MQLTSMKRLILSLMISLSVVGLHGSQEASDARTEKIDCVEMFKSEIIQQNKKSACEKQLATAGGSLAAMQCRQQCKDVLKYKCVSATEPDGRRIDLGIIIDESFSIGGDDGEGPEGRNWHTEKEFVKKLADTVFSDKIHMSMITFSERAKLRIKFDDFSDKEGFKKAVDDTKYMGYLTRIDLALKLAEDEMFTKVNGGRPGVTKVLIVITNGAQTYRPHWIRSEVDPAPIAERLRRKAVRIITMGVPDAKGNLNRDELLAISGEQARIHIKPTFEQIVEEECVHQIQHQMCQSEALCEGEALDIGFVIDSSYSIGETNGTGQEARPWRLEKQFVKDMVNVLHMTKTGIHMSLVVFSDVAKLAIPFNRYHESDKFDAAMDDVEYMGSTTRMDLALIKVEKEMFSQTNGHRPHVPKVLIFLTDGTQSLRGLKLSEVDPIPIAKRIRSTGTRIIAIGVADTHGRIDKNELVGIAGDEKYVHTKSRFEDVLTEEFLEMVTFDSCHGMETKAGDTDGDTE